MSALDAKIAALRPGGTHHIGTSPDGTVRTWVERSGCGTWLRFVRETPNEYGFTTQSIYHECRF